jgi:hypothetical protein
MKLFGIISVGFAVRDQLMFILCIRQTLKKKTEYNETVHQLFIDFKRAYDLVKRLALYNILIVAGALMKLIRMIKMCLNKSYGKARIGKYLSDKFYIQNGLKICFIATAFQLCFRLCY